MRVAKSLGRAFARRIIGLRQFGASALCSVSIAAWAQAPELNMYVFESPAAPMPVSADPVSDGPAVETPFQMVIFDAEAEAVPEAYPRHPVRRKVVDDFTVLVTGDVGYRRDSMAWSVASGDGSADPMTRVEWNDLDTWRIEGRMDIVSPSGITLRGDAGYAWVVNGNGQETGFDGAATEQNADDGDSWDVSLGLGYRWQVGEAESVAFAATPLAGYAWQRQRYTLQGAQQNRYETEWEGPWVGLDTSLSWLTYHELYASAQYHWSSYNASGNWQQLADALHPDSFEHDADATGLYGAVGYRYQLPRSWGVHLSMDYQRWDADAGQERFNFASGGVVISPLTDVSRESFGVNLGVNLKF